MPYLPRLASGALCDCIALRWQFYLPVLSECEYERGNVRRDMKGESTLMDTDAADAIPQGRRQQRRGLVYDPSFTGCSPASWPHTCFPPPHGGMGGRRFLLGGYGEGVEDTIVDVAYSPSVDARMASFADDAIDAHVRKCRVDDPGTGGMCMGWGRTCDGRGLWGTLLCGMGGGARMWVRAWSWRGGPSHLTSAGGVWGLRGCSRSSAASSPTHHPGRSVGMHAGGVAQVGHLGLGLTG